MNPYAAFDVLHIIAVLQDTFDSVAEAEIHLFAYLACLLSLYSGKPVGEWGYIFVGTPTGAPYSQDLQSIVHQFVAMGFLVQKDDFYSTTARGANQLAVLNSFGQNTIRRRFLEAAESTILTLPVGLIRDAILQEPTLKPSSQLYSSRLLLSEPLLSVLYEQFESLKQAVPQQSDDLFVPSTIWLSYMAKNAATSLSSAQGGGE